MSAIALIAAARIPVSERAKAFSKKMNAGTMGPTFAGTTRNR